MLRAKATGGSPMSYLFTSQRELPSFVHLKAEPLSGALGATISGVKLADDLGQDVIDEIYRALLEFKVIFFRDQELDDEQHLRLARKFGWLRTRSCRRP